jgi:hypothetical protein
MRAPRLTFDEAVAQITEREAPLRGLLMTLAGVTALLPGAAIRSTPATMTALR